MQVPKEDVRQDIMKAAKEVFQKKGFLKTSMRDIASRSQVGLSNIYNYFKSKDDLFCQVVEPVTCSLDRMLHEHHGHRGHDIIEMKSDAYFRYAVDEYLQLLRTHRALLTLLFFRSEGSSLANFKDDFTRRSTALVKEYFNAMKEKHPEVEVDVSDFSIHLHSVWMFVLFEELIKQKVREKDLEKIVTEYMTIEVTGWRELMRI